MHTVDPKAVFCRRLKEAREAAGMSQKQLGIAAGLDEFVASTRINRYEVGKHEPDAGMVGRLAEALRVPLAYLYAEDDRLARMILLFARLGIRRRDELLDQLDPQRRA
jgi:transcriptional regulator with XRE-family HTH domain